MSFFIAHIAPRARRVRRGDREDGGEGGGIFFPGQSRAVARSDAGPIGGQRGGRRRPWRMGRGRRGLAPRLPRSLRRGLGMLRLRDVIPQLGLRRLASICFFIQFSVWLGSGSSDLV
jgi:hypothetical protein